MNAVNLSPARSICVARQPIFDRRRRLFGYELLFREGIDTLVSGQCGDAATPSLLLNTYAEIGLDRIAGEHKIFVNFTGENLTSGLPRLFPAERLVVELLEDVEPDADIVEAWITLARDGYLCALDDFVYHPRFEPLIEATHIVKLDFMESSDDDIVAMAKDLGGRGKVLLAEKVESKEDWTRAVDLGCSLFQGFFFSKPEVISTTGMQSLKVHLLEILAELGGDDYNLGRVEKLLARDVATSYKLLRYINSAALRTTQRVTSIRHAVTFLGRDSFRRFVALILSSDLGTDKPFELVRLALVRARFCERVAPVTVRDSEFFLLGLCSLLDALLDQPMDEIVRQLPLPEYLLDALKGRHPYHGFIRLIQAFERGDWDTVSDLASELDVSEEQVGEAYLEAIAWSDELAKVPVAA